MYSRSMAKLNISKYQKRVIFPKGKQKEFVEAVESKLGLNLKELANLAGIHLRSLTDWKREKYSVSLYAFEKLSRKAGLPKPVGVKIKEPFWYVSKGALAGWLATKKKYGERIPVDEKYRKKKWYEWWNKKGRYRKDLITGITKPFKKPKISKELAEFAGIMIGDGGMTKSQIRITFNKETDKDYCDFVENLANKIFNVPISRSYRKNQNAVDLVISRSELVNFCNKKLGLKIGNKLKQGVNIPEWIKRRLEFQKACLKGLIDTDGCIFNEVHKINGKRYSYKRINFTSQSPHLIKSVFSILKKLGFRPFIRRNGGSIQLENKEEINYYFKIIGTSNKKHLTRYLEGYV